MSENCMANRIVPKIHLQLRNKTFYYRVEFLVFNFVPTTRLKSLKTTRLNVWYPSIGNCLI